MIYVILGMHKSGTTLVARILHGSSVNMVDGEAQSVPYDRGGHFERKATNRINKELLGCGSAHSLEVLHPLEGGRWPDDIRSEAEALVSKLDREHRQWGFKDPRSCLTYAFWREVLGPHKIVFIYRQPWELVAHYTTRLSGSRLALATKALRAWHVYNEQALGWLRHTDLPWIKLNYSTLMGGDRPFRALCSFVGGELNDVRSVDHYRSRAGRSFAYRWARLRVRQLYGLDVDELCQSLAELPEQGGGRPLHAPYATGRP